MRTNWSGVIIMALLGSACGGKYGLAVPRHVLAALPYESRIELLEAENELAVAIDRRDELQNDVRRAQRSLQRAWDRRAAAQQEEGMARDEASRVVARLAVAEANARAEYLTQLQEVKRRGEDVEELGVRCALARFELARLQIVKKNKVAGAEGLKPEDFERQVKSCEAELNGVRGAAKDDAKRAEAAKAAWETHKAALAKKTFDARASPFVE